VPLVNSLVRGRTPELWPAKFGHKNYKISLSCGAQNISIYFVSFLFYKSCYDKNKCDQLRRLLQFNFKKNILQLQSTSTSLTVNGFDKAAINIVGHRRKADTVAFRPINLDRFSICTFTIHAEIFVVISVTQKTSSKYRSFLSLTCLLALSLSCTCITDDIA